MRVLITGGAGFIGSHLAEELLNRGDMVYVIDDLSTGRLENVEHLMSSPRFNIAVENILNETVMDRLVSECDIIYHLAAAVGVELIVNKPVEVIERNILGTEMVLKLAARYLKDVVITSTSEIYGKSEKVPFRETDDRVLGPTIKNRWSYSSTKAIDEFLALAYHKEKNIGATIVRLFNTVGPRQTGRYGMVIPRFVVRALKNEPITVYGSGQQIRCFGYVSDVINGMISLANNKGANGQIFNLGNDQPISILDLAKKIKEKTDSKSEIVFVPYNEAYEEGFEDMSVRIPDLSKIKTLVGYEPKYNLDMILDEVIKYFSHDKLAI
ncbi:MAG: NAD-dependent epimerase/dehydratase family protein [Calditrichaeota bacterium]|nr:NAD-dependent epimerase/dehydratase family protein [Calditrichota bacterium]